MTETVKKLQKAYDAFLKIRLFFGNKYVILNITIVGSTILVAVANAFEQAYRLLRCVCCRSSKNNSIRYQTDGFIFYVMKERGDRYAS